MMERLVNLARGCFRVELTGASPANFLNRMAVEALPFWDARPEGEFTLRVTIHADSLVRARQLARLLVALLHKVQRLQGLAAPATGARALCCSLTWTTSRHSTTP